MDEKLETLSVLMYLWNAWDQDEARLIYNKILGDHFWGKWQGKPGIFMAEMTEDNLDKLVTRACELYCGRASVRNKQTGAINPSIYEKMKKVGEKQVCQMLDTVSDTLLQTLGAHGIKVKANMEHYSGEGTFNNHCYSVAFEIVSNIISRVEHHIPLLLEYDEQQSGEERWYDSQRGDWVINLTSHIERLIKNN